MDIKSIGDVRSIRQCSDFTKGVDVVIHLAALVDVQESIRMPKTYHQTNVIGTLNLLKASHLSKVERFIYISSAAAGNPISPYGIQKLTSEKYCDFFNKSYELSTISLRPFNIYGPGNGKGVIDKWIDTIRSNGHPVIYGGSQCRDFIYIDDVIDHIIAWIDSPRTGVLDISTGIGTNMLDLCDLLLRVMDRTDLQPIIKPQQKGEIQKSIGMPCLHQYSLEDGLRKML
jgi:UDP-glucose 4-epimerase